MRVIWANLDHETAVRAGAGDTFQVISLEDDDGAELTNIVDTGRHYGSISQLEADLMKALNEEVTVEER